MQNVYVVDATRSPIGKFLGSLSEIGATHLGAQVVRGMLSRTKINENEIDEVIVGNVISAGIGQNPAKQVVVYSGLPNEVSAYSVNKVCASGLKAVALGAQSISAGNADVIIAGGIESMSNAPFSIKGVRQYNKLGDISLDAFLEKATRGNAGMGDFKLVDELVNAGLWDCYNDLHMGSLAERLGKKYSITRQEEDEFALSSHAKAAAAEDSGKFKREIIPIKLPDGRMFEVDEGIRRDTSIERLSSLKPAFDANGTVTAGNASQLSDGASFLILMSEGKMKTQGLKPLAKIEGYASSGTDPAMYGIAPISAINNVLKKTNHALGDIDLIELNEAFCVQALSVAKDMGIDTHKLNVNGGATALGHPLGASGARILTTLIYAMRDRNSDLGLAALCHGGGGAAAMVVRRA